MTDCWRRALPQASVRGSRRGYRYLSCPQCRHRLAAMPTIAEQTDFEEAARAPPLRFWPVVLTSARNLICGGAAVIRRMHIAMIGLCFPRWQWRCQADLRCRYYHRNATEARSLRANLGAKRISGNMGWPAAVYPIVILIGRCVGELLPWSSPENIGRSF